MGIIDMFRGRRAARLREADDSKADRSQQEQYAEIGRLVSMAITSAPVGGSASSMYRTQDGLWGSRTYAEFVDANRSWVYSCVDKIAKTVASVPIELYVYRSRQTGRKVILPQGLKAQCKSWAPGERKAALQKAGLIREKVDDHPVLDLFRRPNSTMTRMTLWYETMIRLELTGICCWYMPRNRLGLPGEIWPLPLTRTASIRPKVNGRAEIEYWLYRDGDVVQRMPPEEILFFRYPSPESPWHGMSPLMAQQYPYDIDLYMMQQQRALYSNMAVPGLHLHTEQSLTAKQVEELRRYLTEQFAGATRAGMPLVTHSGLSVERTSVTPKEALLADVARWAREKLISAYDLSEGKLGLVADVNRANGEFLDETFIRECLRPKCMLIEETIEAHLLPRYDDGLEADFALPDLGNREFRLEERKANLSTMYSTINEERARDGLEPVPWGDAPWLPMTQVQWTGGGQGAASVPQATSSGAVTDGEDESIDEDEQEQAG